MEGGVEGEERIEQELARGRQAVAAVLRQREQRDEGDGGAGGAAQAGAVRQPPRRGKSETEEGQADEDGEEPGLACRQAQPEGACAERVAERENESGVDRSRDQALQRDARREEGDRGEGEKRQRGR